MSNEQFMMRKAPLVESVTTTSGLQQETGSNTRLSLFCEQCVSQGVVFLLVVVLRSHTPIPPRRLHRSPILQSVVRREFDLLARAMSKLRPAPPKPERSRAAKAGESVRALMLSIPGFSSLVPEAEADAEEDVPAEEGKASQGLQFEYEPVLPPSQTPPRRYHVPY